MDNESRSAPALLTRGEASGYLRAGHAIPTSHRKLAWLGDDPVYRLVRAAFTGAGAGSMGPLNHRTPA
jgi:hypothetical protein